MKTLGLDPAQIKYVIVSHGHGDHSGGAKYLQDKYGAHIILSEADWDLLDRTRNNPNAQPVPKRDMMYVTHDQEEAMTLGSRIAVMQAGMVEQVGRPLDVYRYPANRFVASFIGSPRVNLCACTCARSSANWSFASPLFVQPLVLPRFDGELPARVEVGFRPQDIELRATDEAHGDR